MSSLIQRLQYMADDAMGMEPEDRRAILEAITELGKLASLETENRTLRNAGVDLLNRAESAESRLDAVRSQWAQYRAYLEAKYPAKPGETWQFTCPEHLAIQAILVEIGRKNSDGSG